MKTNDKNDKKYDVFTSQVNLAIQNYAFNNVAIDLLIDIKAKLYDLDTEKIQKEVNESYVQYQESAKTFLKEVTNS